jgi:hypothetical protein
MTRISQTNVQSYVARPPSFPSTACKSRFTANCSDGEHKKRRAGTRAQGLQTGRFLLLLLLLLLLVILR